MTAPRELLIQLLDYIKEQAKEINPQGYRLASVRGFMRVRDDIAGLPGAEFDLRVEGDHIWLPGAPGLAVFETWDSSP